MPAINSGMHVALFSNFHLGIYAAMAMTYESIKDFFKFSFISIFNCPFRNLMSFMVIIKFIVKHLHIMDLSLYLPLFLGIHLIHSTKVS